MPPTIQFPLELLVIAAAYFDLRSRRIPNWLTLLGAGIGFGLNSANAAWPGLKMSIQGFAMAAAVYILLFALRGMGGGDVKLMAAVGAFSGPQAWLWIFAITAIIGGIMAIGTLLLRGGLLQALRNVGTILSSLAKGQAPHTRRPDLDVAHPQARTLPHGVAIALGVFAYLLWFHRYA